MKKMYGLFCLLFSFCFSFSQAQNNVGINTTSPEASAALDVTSTSQGVLVPRMSQGQRNLISSPATGLLIYQNDNTPGFYFYNGTAWTAIAGGGASLPSQTGYSGKALTTNGTSTSWTQVTPYMAKTTATQLVNTTSPNYTTIVGINLEAGKTYLVTAQVFGNRTGSTTTNITTRLRYTGNATTDLGITYANGSFVSGTVFNNSGTHDTEAAGFGSTATTSIGQRYELRCYLTTSTSGTFYIEMARATTNTSNDFNIVAGSYIMATPVQ